MHCPSTVKALVLLAGLLLAACQNPLQQVPCEDDVKRSDCASAASGPLQQTVFVRGGFNGWGSDNPLRHVGGGKYQAEVLVGPGNHEFKLATVDWRQEWVVQGQGKHPITPDTPYVLEQRGGAGSFAFVRDTGRYRFTLDFSRPEAPTLMFSRLPGEGVPARDPHRKHPVQVERNYLTWDGRTEQVIISTNNPEHKLRRYGHSTTQSQRDPIAKARNYEEKEGYPRLRSGDIAFDGLFALALEEMRLDSVSQIKDGNYNEGRAIPCDCFETGAKWHYVWTRDLAYAAHLGLAMLDPERVRNSLDFKLSPYRDGIVKAPAVPGTDEGLQIVQDTGTGGSWPISTDRMSWAFGASAALAHLRGEDEAAFAQRAYQALKNTIEIDRVAAFDGSDGLYLGEQSFLDWREQSYASWITDDIASLGSAKALSTNVGHYQALRLASQLAQRFGERVDSVKYQDWAVDLKNAINARFWQPETGLYASITGPHFADHTLRKYDWLGISLAVTSGVADEARARQALARYPHGPLGAPVIFPQQPDIPVYHNRAIWPFVTAYGLKAATRVGNSAVADAAYSTLVRGAALNMSNMENLEWLSAQPLLLDEQHPELSGPVINSQRQLWSVGAYLGMVIEGVFGVHADAEGVSFAPFISSQLRREQFADSRSIALFDLSLRGHNFDMRVFLPEASARQGHYQVQEVLINGVAVTSGRLNWVDAKAANTVVVRLGALVEDGQGLTRVTGNPYATDDPALFAPREPRIAALQVDDEQILLSVAGADHTSKTSVAVYHNGKRVSDFSRDRQRRLPRQPAFERGCFSAVTRYDNTGRYSHPSAPQCLDAGQEIRVDDKRVAGNRRVLRDIDGRKGPFFADWGFPDDVLEVRDIRLETPGRHAFQLKYHNGYNQINLGISNGVKWASLVNEHGTEVARGVLQMPHAKVVDGRRPWVYSSPLIADLPAGRYRLTLSDFTNMSYLQSNTTFTGSGGERGPANRFDIQALRVLPLAPVR